MHFSHHHLLLKRFIGTEGINQNEVKLMLNALESSSQYHTSKYEWEIQSLTNKCINFTTSKFSSEIYCKSFLYDVNKGLKTNWQKGRYKTKAFCIRQMCLAFSVRQLLPYSMNPLLETANKSSREQKLWNKQAKDENSQGLSLLHGH